MHRGIRALRAGKLCRCVPGARARQSGGHRGRCVALVADQHDSDRHAGTRGRVLPELVHILSRIRLAGGVPDARHPLCRDVGGVGAPMKWRFALTFLTTFALLLVLWWWLDVAALYRL